MGHWKLNETTGSTASDSVGDNGGTLNNFGGTYWVTGKVGNGLDFDGTDDYVAVPYDADLNPVSFSVSLWAKVEGGQDNWRTPICCRAADNGPGGYTRMGYNLYAGDDNKWQFWTGGHSEWDIQTGSNISVDTWTHLAATFEATSGPDGNGCYTGVKTFYIDGEEVASDSSASYKPMSSDPDLREDLIIGSVISQETQYFPFNGVIDHVMLYNRMLYENEIKAICKRSLK